MQPKKYLFDIQLNSISDTDNPTRKEVEFILHDFNISHNNAFISKESALKSLHTLKDMPIVAKYYPVSQSGAKDDALGGHEAFIDQDRDTGGLMIGLNTVPIGVFTEPAYIKTIEQNGEEVEVVAGKGILWSSRFPNVVGLLKEWVDNGIQVFSSMEILYDSFLFKDGVEEILSYVYEGHCILNSEDRGEHSKIYPAYDVSKLNKLVAQALVQEVKKEGEIMKFTKVFELSHSDIRSRLYGEMQQALTEAEYDSAWIVDVYDNNFIYEVWIENEGYKFYQVDYSKTDDTVTASFDSKVEVMEQRQWVKVEQVQALQAQIDEAVTKVGELNTQVNSLSGELEVVKNEKTQVENQFNETSEKLLALNAQVEELKPFKEQFEQAQFEKDLNEKITYYSEKFEAVSGKEKFETAEIQDLIKLSLKASDEGKNAVLQLNSILVEMVKPVQASEETGIREFASKRENLIPTSNDFDSRYSI